MVMKTKLRITKGSASIYEGIYDVSDAESFGEACADAWWALKQRQMEKETSIGALMEHLERDVLHELIGAHVTLERAA
jgi:hypothetical protein